MNFPKTFRAEVAIRMLQFDAIWSLGPAPHFGRPVLGCINEKSINSLVFETQLNEIFWCTCFCDLGSLSTLNRPLRLLPLEGGDLVVTLLHALDLEPHSFCDVRDFDKILTKCFQEFCQNFAKF